MEMIKIDLNYIDNQANKMFDFIVDVRRHLHKNPELSEKEFETQKFIIDFLIKENIKYYKIANTGVVALIDGFEFGKVVALRADIDALPLIENNDKDFCSLNRGVMHGCGHDAHTAINIGVAKFFNDNKDKFKGTVKIFFQPAEETVGGAMRMVLEGCMENPKVDYVLGLHVVPYLPYNTVELKRGTLNSSADTITLIIKGKGGHGAYPDCCIDSIVIAANIIVSLQSVVSRMISPLEQGVLTLGTINGGTAGNIICSEVKIVGTLRADSLNLREKMINAVKNISSQVAKGMGGLCEFKIQPFGYVPLVNDDDVLDIIEDVAKDYLGEQNVVYKKSTSMGGEDFSFFNLNTKGAFYHLGCKLPNTKLLHTAEFDIDERCLKTGLVLEICSALAFLKI